MVSCISDRSYCFRESLCADDVDAGDLRRIALLDREVDRDPVALLRRHRGRHLRRVVAAGDVLALHFLLGAVERAAVEDARFGDADVLQRLLQRVGVEFLVAGNVDPADRRPLLHDDDQHAVLRLEPDVLEESGRVQRLDRLRRLRVVDAVADLHGEIGEHRAGLGALHALDADVLHHERGERPRRVRREKREHQRGKRRQQFAESVCCGALASCFVSSDDEGAYEFRWHTGHRGRPPGLCRREPEQSSKAPDVDATCHAEQDTKTGGRRH